MSLTTGTGDDVLYSEVFVPPDGEQFWSGVVVTHDLNTALADIVAPSLAGISTGEPERRRQEARAEINADKDRGLLVLACDDRIQPVPATPWIRIEGVAGARLHAKFALLVFTNDKFKTTTVRAVVTSANLTRGGLTANREVVVWEDSTAKRKGGSLGWELTVLIKKMGGIAFTRQASLSVETARRLRKVADDARELLVQPKQSAHVVHETITQVKPLLPPAKTPAKRVMVVSPAFAGTGDDAARAIDGYLAWGTRVDLYIGAEYLPGAVPEKAPIFSPATVARLRERVGKDQVRVHLVPELVAGDGEVPARRALHAKLIGVMDGSDTARVFAGSANFTRSGLLGFNRELVAECVLPTHALLEFVERLEASHFTGETAEPTRVEFNAKVVARPDLAPSFYIALGEEATARSWHGTLTLVLPPKKLRPISITVNGHSFAPEEALQVSLAEADCSIEIEWPDGTISRQLVSVHAPTDDFWEQIGSPDSRESLDREFLNALFDLRRAGKQAAGEAGPAQPGKANALLADGFRIPLAQRLVVLARFRERLIGELGRGYLVEQLSKWFTQPVEREVALTIVEAAVGRPATSKDPLLVTLHEALPMLGNEG